MEARVHQELLSFLAKHNIEDSVSNIDDIVLNYLVGVVELVSQGDDGLDIVELMDMMNAYLPGFGDIGRSEVIDWMFGLANKLMGSKSDDSQNDEEDKDNCNAEEVETVKKEHDNIEDTSTQSQQMKERKFPSYNYGENTGEKSDKYDLDTVLTIPKSDSCGQNLSSSPSKDSSTQKDCEQSTSPITFISSSMSSSSTMALSQSFPLSSSMSDTPNSLHRSKRKGRQLSCSSQESQDDSLKVDGVTVEESTVRMLLEMFPAACRMEAQHCLQLSSGDMDRAVQLIMDRQETGQAIKGQAGLKSMKKNHKVKKTTEYKLDDDSIKSCVLEKYSFVDTEEDKKTYRPSPPKGEAKKLVRYRDGQVVSMKGERFSEVKKKEEEDMKSTYVNLKPARKYRFH